MPHPSRPRLIGRIVLYALAGVFGLSCVVIGGSWFAAGKGTIITGVPGSLVEAVACTAGGVAVMLWAKARILREWCKRGTETQER
ncbi:hypothetical protein [Azonexus sp.]|jgi:hypothetical protein|uniref:hypothetical protein n=1 Tax=Azonexus sp. TaxID=1872668 RepID=UPI002836CE52|nr:hypothetical protein [Azonexus sp.]MDR1996526.1 hypothetical protein [Azonexus sp.]